MLSALGFDPLSMFLALSSIILSFAFMIGSASAKYFEVGDSMLYVTRGCDKFSPKISALTVFPLSRWMLHRAFF